MTIKHPTHLKRKRAPKEGPAPLLVYFAGSYSERLKWLGRVREIEEVSRELGCPIVSTSTWLLGIHESKEGDASIEEMAGWAMADIADIQAAEVLVQFAETPSTTGGMHVELGLAALMGGMEVAVCGPVTNPFQALSWVYRFDEWQACREWLIGCAVRRDDKMKEAA